VAEMFLDAIRDPWRLDSYCRDMDPSEFFTEPGKMVSAEVIYACGVCKVRAECLEYALTENIKYGYWGGKSPRQRQKIKRDRRRRWTTD